MWCHFLCVLFFFLVQKEKNNIYDAVSGTKGIERVSSRFCRRPQKWKKRCVSRTLLMLVVELIRVNKNVIGWSRRVWLVSIEVMRVLLVGCRSDEFVCENGILWCILVLFSFYSCRSFLELALEILLANAIWTTLAANFSWYAQGIVTQKE